MLARVCFLVLLGIGCVGLTDVCGCPPSYLGTSVRGTLRDATGAPLPGTRFFLMARLPSGAFMEPPPADQSFDRSAADGTFIAEVMGSAAGLNDVRAAVYVETTPVVVDLGQMTFYLNGNGPYAQRDIVLPP